MGLLYRRPLSRSERASVARAAGPHHPVRSCRAGLRGTCYSAIL